MQNPSHHRIHHLTTYSKPHPPININFHSKYSKNRNQHQLDSKSHGYQLYRATSHQEDVSLNNRAKMNQIQLFTKLRQNKYASNKQNDPNVGNTNCISNRMFSHLKTMQPSNQVQQRPAEQSIKLTQYQQQLLQNLKLQKVNEIVNECMLSGFGLREVMEHGGILGDLDDRICRILQTEEVCGSVNSNMQYVKPCSILESTAQYWEPNSRKLDSLEPVSNYNENNSEDQLLSSQFQKKPTLASIPHIQSTIKNLQSPNHLFLNPTTFDSFNKNVITTQPNNPNNQNKINVMQFTLGQLQSIADQENFTQREQSQKIIEDIMMFNQKARLEQKKKSGDEGKYKISQFIEFSGHKQSDQTLHQSKKEPTQQKVKGLCFNRNKLPKGKAIKNKVMGHPANT